MISGHLWSTLGLNDLGALEFGQIGLFNALLIRTLMVNLGKFSTLDFATRFT